MRYVNSDSEALAKDRVNIKVHYFTGGKDVNGVDAVFYPHGWYWWTIGHGHVFDGDPVGPFDSEIDAINDAQGNN